jgi:hypothetical protein
VFSKGKVLKGTLVWTSTKQSARFKNASDYRQFLHSIPRRDLVCDVVEFSYVQSFGESRDASDSMICVDLDEGCFMNADDENEEANLSCTLGDDENNLKEHLNCYALHDIEPGEELICDYGDFAIVEGWKWFAL